MQVVAAMDNLVQFTFDLDAAGSDFTGDLAGLAYENFFGSELTVDGAVDSCFFRDVERALENHAVSDHKVVGLIKIGCHRTLTVKGLILKKLQVIIKNSD